jgi:rRNA maturation RNase YbeY
MVEINNQTQFKINQSLIKKIAERVIGILKRKTNLSIAVVGRQEMRRLNRSYRKRDKMTDVLSFEELNEIVICYPQVRKQAKMAGHSINDEMTLLLVHGLLHLLGYDHQNKKQAIKMQWLADKILAKLRKSVYVF